MTDDIDPVEEMHRIRAEMYAEAGGTPAAFVRYLRALEKKRERKPGRRDASGPSRATPRRRRAAGQ